MNELQESQLETIKARCSSELDAKYRKGQQEHGGNLWDRDITRDIIDESLDLITYAYTMDYKIRQSISLIENVITKLHGQEALEAEKLLLVQAIETLTKNKTPQPTE